LLRLIRQRWSIENEWHWARDVQLGEDAHRYAHRTGAPVFSLLKTVVMNLLRRGGYRSIRQGLRELAYDIKGMLALGGVTTPTWRHNLITLLSSPDGWASNSNTSSLCRNGKWSFFMAIDTAAANDSPPRRH
jgi:hypothetical protein